MADNTNKYGGAGEFPVSSVVNMYLVGIVKIDTCYLYHEKSLMIKYTT